MWWHLLLRCIESDEREAGTVESNRMRLIENRLGAVRRKREAWLVAQSGDGWGNVISGEWWRVVSVTTAMGGGNDPRAACGVDGFVDSSSCEARAFGGSVACGVGSFGAATVAAADQVAEEAAVEREEEGQTWKRTRIGTSEVGWDAPSDGAVRDWQLGVCSW